MKIEFAPSFFKSLRKVAIHSTWWYKTYEFFRRDLWWFFGNIWRFKKELYRHRNWDPSFSLSMLRRSLEEQCKGIEIDYPYEVEESRLKKVEKIKRAIEILKWHEDDLFMELAEKQLGYDVDTSYLFSDEEPTEVREKNRVIYDLSTKLEDETWKELFKILEGQDGEEYSRLWKEVKESGGDDDFYNNWFDGSGMKGWWS